MTLLLGIPTVLVLWYGGRQVIAGDLTIGGPPSSSFYLGMLAGFVSRPRPAFGDDLPHISAGRRILRSSIPSLTSRPGPMRQRWTRSGSRLVPERVL